MSTHSLDLPTWSDQLLRLHDFFIFEYSFYQQMSHFRQTGKVEDTILNFCVTLDFDLFCKKLEVFDIFSYFALR